MRGILALGLAVVWMGWLGGCKGEQEHADTPQGVVSTTRPADSSEPADVLMVIAAKDFRDEELFTPMRLLEEAGHSVDIASSSRDEATGMKGGKAQPNRRLADTAAQDYKAIVFIGGSGAKEYWGSPEAHALCQDAAAGDQLLAAICIAPVTLARAGVLEGKQAVVWPDNRGELSKAGANLAPEGTHVVVDGDVITGDGPEAADEFGQALVEWLSERG